MLYNSSEHTIKDWADTTVNQTGLGGRSIYYPRGKVLGGSSAINGMYLVRQPAVEQESWANIVSGISSTAKSTWGWDNMLAAMKKSETFTPPTDEVQTTLKSGAGGQDVLKWDAASHGTSGNIHASWPAVTFDSIGAFLQGLSTTLNLPVNGDPDSGNNTGPFLSTSAINPSNWTRSFSRSGYVDPYARPNLFILTGHQATKIVFDDSTPPRAKGVQFAASRTDKVRQVNADKEVIISAGVVGSPQLLQLSGVGDNSILSPLGIKQVADVPGVGFHMQDHLSGAVSYNAAAGKSQPATSLTGDAKTDSFANAAVAYVPVGTVTDKEKLISKLKSSQDTMVSSYKAPATVQAGYRAALNELTDNIFRNDAPAIEILWFLAFGGVTVQCGLQHPTSQGSVKITSASAFDLPAIDPAYLLNTEDRQVLRNGCKLARKVGESAAVKAFVGNETAPGLAVQSNKDWNNYIDTTFATEYHPSSSCAMMPLEQGGVVDDRMRVYNTQGLRVIDASVPPITFSQHLLTVVYGLSEIGADLIAADNGAAASDTSLAPTASASASSASSSASAAAKPGSNDATGKSSGASSLTVGLLPAVVAALAVLQLA